MKIVSISLWCECTVPLTRGDWFCFRCKRPIKR
jgi:hypothetical protein